MNTFATTILSTMELLGGISIQENFGNNIQILEEDNNYLLPEGTITINGENSLLAIKPNNNILLSKDKRKIFEIELDQEDNNISIRYNRKNNKELLINETNKDIKNNLLATILLVREDANKKRNGNLTLGI